MSSVLKDPVAQPGVPQDVGGVSQPTFQMRDSAFHPLPLALRDYWESKRRGGRLPARGDIDPSEIRALLPFLMICDVLRDPLNLRYRLWGTELAYWLGGDPTGLRADQLGIPQAEREAQLSVLDRVLRAGRPVFYGGEHRLQTGQRRPFEAVALPLASDGENIDMLLSGVGLHLP